MEHSKYRILVVDDYEPWRQFLCSTLQKRPELQVIGHASDGLQAVQQSQGLQPDLILLDIGLPTLNGIEAARRIRQVCPKAKILFISENRSTEIAEEALRAGGSGYVIKSDAGSELLPAIDAVLQGNRFVTARLLGLDHQDAVREQAVHLPHPDKAAGKPEENGVPAHRHEAGFYSEDRWLLDDLTRFIGAALKSGNAAVVIATEAHRFSLNPRLSADGVDIEAALREGRFIALDVADCLPTFMVGGMPDPGRFMEVLGNLILTAAKATTKTRSRVALFGECSPLLWAQGKPEAAIQTEKLANQLVKAHKIDVLCGYHLGQISEGVDNSIFQQICMEHSAVHSK
jgi:DNA-binding NarL/FixJ family response regulator